MKGTRAQTTDLVAGIAELAVTLDRRRQLQTELADLVAWFDQSGLVTVVAEQGLLHTLEGLLADARTRFADLVGAPADAVTAAISEIARLVRNPFWEAGQACLDGLRGRVPELRDAIAELNRDRNDLLLRYEDFRNLAIQAVRVGALTDPDAELSAEVCARLRDVDPDIDRGRWDTTAKAVALARTELSRHGLSDPKVLDGRRRELIERTRELGDAEAAMARRTELFLISGRPMQGQIPFKVMVRRPGFRQMQETNLHDDSSILEGDHRLYEAVVDEIAAASVAGIRKAVALRAVDPSMAGVDAGVPADAGDPGPAAVQVRRAAPVGSDWTALRELEPGLRLEKVGRWMYSLLIPDAMQRLIDETADIPLTITSNNPELPWELLHDGDDFLCLKRTFARMPAGQTFPRRSPNRSTTAPTTTRVLLLDSVPDGDLVEAGQEVDELEELLKGQSHTLVTRISGEQVTTNRLTDELSSGSYDVIHYAGHAGFDPDRPGASYLLTAGRVPFVADRIQRLLQGHPVVFLNACESSRSGADPAGATGGIVAQAQGLASAFVYGGARACVGALWPVFDDSARDFAGRFYTELLDRHARVGQALLAARTELRSSREDRVTWAAYALYGDPAHRIGDDEYQPLPTG